MPRNWRMILGGLFFALMFLYHGTNFYFQAVEVGSYAGWHGYSNDRRHFYTTNVDTDGPITGIQEGDELIAVNGIHPADDISVLGFADSAPAGTPFSMTFLHNGQVFTIDSRTIAFPPGKYPYRSIYRFFYSLFWVLFLITGAALLFLKAEDRQAWLLALMLGTFAGIDTVPYPYHLFGATFEWIIRLPLIAAVWFFPLFALFYLNFPDRSKLLLRWPRLEWLILGVHHLLLLPLWLYFQLPSELHAQYQKLPFLSVLFALDKKIYLTGWVMSFFLVAGFFFIGFNYWQANPAARRRIRVAVFGSTPGFLGLLLQVLQIFPVFRKLPGWGTLMEWMPTALYVALPLIPLSFAYAIIRHKVIPISLIIRRGVRYLLVLRGSILLVLIGVGLAIWFFMDAFFRYFHINNGRIVGTFSALIAVIGWHYATTFHQRKVAPAIDRKFFRQSYDAQQIISELNESIRSVTDQPQLFEQVATRIQSALQTKNVAIFLRNATTGNYALRFVCDYDIVGKCLVNNPAALTGQDINLPVDGALLQQAAHNGSALEVESLLTDAEVSESPHTSANTELITLHAINAALLLPLKVKDELLGVITVGPRLSDLPFSNEDKRLLLSVAAPTSFALENARLVEQMIAEARRREEIEAENEARAKELEEARQLQLSMLPRKLPQIPNLDIAAYMKTATEVGGDYYDFHQSNGTLTIAVGDATGHGLKAGTIVTATKSLFNNLAALPDITEVFRQSSLALKQMNLRSLYMAMTMMKLQGSELQISLAGMPPVLVYRARTHSVEEVALRGMPLGSIPNYPYQQRTIMLEKEDVIVVMSDGFPERFNPFDEELGFEKAAEILTSTAHQSAQQIIQQFVQHGDEWGGTRPQDDDVTFVVLKIVAN